MNGPEHYRAAEAILSSVDRLAQANHGKAMFAAEAEGLRADMAISVLAAQVHATLALAAATLAATHAEAVPSGTHEDWWGVMGGAG